MQKKSSWIGSFHNYNCVNNLGMNTAGSRIRGHLHPHIWCYSRTHCKPKVQWSRNADRERSMRGASSYDSDIVNWAYIGSSSEPLPDYCICGASPLPMGSRACLYCSASFGIHLCFFCSQRCFSPLYVRWCHSSLRQQRPSLRPRVPHHI